MCACVEHCRAKPITNWTLFTHRAREESPVASMLMKMRHALRTTNALCNFDMCLGVFDLNLPTTERSNNVLVARVPPTKWSKWPRGVIGQKLWIMESAMRQLLCSALMKIECFTALFNNLWIHLTWVQLFCSNKYY